MKHVSSFSFTDSYAIVIYCKSEEKNCIEFSESFGLLFNKTGDRSAEINHQTSTKLEKGKYNIHTQWIKRWKTDNH